MTFLKNRSAHDLSDQSFGRGTYPCLTHFKVISKVIMYNKVPYISQYSLSYSLTSYSNNLLQVTCELLMVVIFTASTVTKQSEFGNICK